MLPVATVSSVSPAVRVWTGSLKHWASVVLSNIWFDFFSIGIQCTSHAVSHDDRFGQLKIKQATNIALYKLDSFFKSRT